MKVGIGFWADERHCCPHSEEVSLERQPRCGQMRWSGAADEGGDRCIAERKKPGSVLKRLHLPAFDATRQWRRESKVTSVGWRCNPCREHRDCDHKEDEEGALAWSQRQCLRSTWSQTTSVASLRSRTKRQWHGCRCRESRFGVGSGHRRQ